MTQGPNLYSPYSNVVSATVSPSGTTTLRVFNNLPGGAAEQINSLLSVRIGPNESSVLGPHPNQYERLTMEVERPEHEGPGLVIAPGSYMDFDVSNYPNGFWVFLQAGRWDFFCYPPDYSYCVWTKHDTEVYGCMHEETYKWATIHHFPPFGNPEELYARWILPDYSWYGSEFCD
jgi:hypothetical protein